jgi:outer membrane lipoprotein-sorting protein
MVKAASAAVALSLLAPQALAATRPAAAKLSDDERAAVGRLEQYLNEFRTVAARFIQVASDGSYAEGQIRLQRPGKLRIDYDPPSQVLILTTGSWLVYWDKSNGQITHVPINSTPAGILVRERLSLASGELTITRFARKAGIIEMTLVRTEEPAEGSITLVFSDGPLALRQWIITDAQGISTSVTLADARFGVRFDDEIFKFEDPNIFGQPN